MSPMRMAALAMVTVSCWAQAPSGRWDGKIAYGKLSVPFTLFFEGKGSGLTASFLNGDSRVTSTAAMLQGESLTLSFAQIGTKLEAKLGDGGLQGTYGGEKTGTRAVTAAAYCTCSYEGEAGPDISGVWTVAEADWKLTIRRKEQDTLVTVSRSGGDVGPLAGRFDGLSFGLHFFDGEHVALMELEPTKDDQLTLTWTEPQEPIKKYKAARLKNP